MNSPPPPARRKLLLLVAAVVLLGVWTAASHTAWRRVESPLHGLPAFFLGLVALIFLAAVARLGIGAWRKGGRWLFSRESVRIAGWAVVFAVSSVVLFYSIERWRGKRAWNAVVQLAEQSRETLRLQDLVPPPVPDPENFARADCFADLLQTTASSESKVLGNWAHIAYWGLWPSLHTPNVKECPWLDQELTDFRVLLDFWRGWEPPVAPDESADPMAMPASKQPVPDLNRQDSAALFLRGMTNFNIHIEAVRQAATRPYSRFPLDYSRQMFDPNPYGAVLNGITRILRVRASARLAVGLIDPACEDTLLALRICDLARQQPWPMTDQRRLAVFADALQPVWEGLAAGQWQERHLVNLQKSIERIQSLQDYPHSVRLSAFALADFCEAVIPTSETPPSSSLDLKDPVQMRMLRIARALYPRGWSLLDQAALHSQRLRTLSHWQSSPHETEARTLLNGTSDPFFGTFLAPRAIEMLHLKSWFHFAQCAADQARLACALERFRIAHGTYPQRLGELAPGFLAAVPRDVLNNEPYHYRADDPSAFVLYSIGRNRKDDGGTVYHQPDGTRSSVECKFQHGDWVWSHRPKTSSH